MDRKAVAQRIAVTGKVLVAASLFLMLVWWHISATLFVAGWMLYGVAWWVAGADDPALCTLSDTEA